MSDEATLVTDPETEPSYTVRRDTDAHTALTRGLSQYLRALTFDIAGRQFQLKEVFETWAEPEDVAEYPSAVVYGPERAEYDASSFSPVVGAEGLPEGYSLMKGSEATMVLSVDLYSADPDERMSLVAMVEDALLPVDWMYGARLALPHYFGQHADYALVACTYVDDAVKAQQRLRIAHLEVEASVGVLRAVHLPKANLKSQVSVSAAAIDGSKRKGKLVVGR